MNDHKRIIVADDEAGIRNLLFEVLSGKGFQVTLAKDGRDCLNRMKRDRFDLLITDIHMPRLDGIEMLRRMKQDGRREKVIVMSGIVCKPEIMNRKDLPPVFRFLQKPFLVKHFLKTISAVFDKPGKPEKKEARRIRYH